MSRARSYVLLAAALSNCGCGLVFQGFTQDVDLITHPPGAHVTFRSREATTPATLAVSRRFFGYATLRAEKEGHYSGCQIVSCATPTWIKVLDSLPAAVPLALDAALGTLGNCEPSSMALDPLPPGGVSFKLPGDGQLVSTFLRYRLDMCRHPYLYDPDFAKSAARILVTAGGLQRHYEELGAVDFGQAGADSISGVTVAFAGFASTQVTRTFSQATPAEVNELLRRRALRLYGDRVDAVINVAYETNPRHDVFGTGLAVRFVAGGGEPLDIAARLEELERLRDRGLVTETEFNELRGDLLEGLRSRPAGGAAKPSVISD